MKNKKLVSLFLALAMVFAMAVPAFADGNTTNLAGDFRTYAIDVDIPSNGSIIINPYQIEFTPTGADETTSAQVINPTTFVENNTEIPLKVSAKITTTWGTSNSVSPLTAVTQVNAKAETVPDTDTDFTLTGDNRKYDAKAGFLVFEIMKATDGETEPSWSKPETFTPALAGSSGTSKTQKILTATSTGDELVDCLELDPVVEGEDPNYFAFHVDGYLNVYPYKRGTANDKFEANDWAATDKITVSVVLSFKPNVDVKTYT